MTTAWVGALLKASAFDEIWTVDVHSEEDKRLIPLPLESLSPARIFGECLGKLALIDVALCLPTRAPFRVAGR